MDATKKGSEITLDADTVYFTEGSTINADNLVLRNISVTGNPEDKTGENATYGANIDHAQINNCKINSCEISSQIKSKVYTSHKDSSDKKGVGFLFDAGSAETGNFDFAIYSGDGGRITKDSIVVPKVESTNFTSEGTDKKGFSLDALNSDGSFAFYGQTSDGDKFELTNNSLVIPSAVIGDVTVDTIQSKNYTEDTSGNPNITLTEDDPVGFKLSSSTNKFYVKGENYELNNGVISLENTDSLILGDKSFTEWLKNAGTWDEFITDIKGDLNVEGSITAEALYAKTSDYVIKIGGTVDQGTTERFTYSGMTHSQV